MRPRVDTGEQAGISLLAPGLDDLGRTPEDLAADYRLFGAEVRARFQRMPDSGKMPIEIANRDHAHEIMLKVSPRWGPVGRSTMPETPDGGWDLDDREPPPYRPAPPGPQPETPAAAVKKNPSEK